MGDLLDAAKTTYAAGPSSDPHEPVKGEIIGLFSLIESIIGTTLDGLLVGNAVLKSTRALLYADLAHAAGTLGLVYNDSTPAYNGYYLKSGASGSGSWAIQTSLSLPSTFAADLADAIADIVVLQADVAGKLDATVSALGTLIAGSAAKTTPVDADSVAISDSAASGVAKKTTFGNLKTWVKSWIVKGDVGLGNVDNTSDANKPVSTDQAAAIGSAVAPANTHIARTDNPHSTTKTQVGLGNVDNTSDVNKPVSTAQQAALDAKINNSIATDRLLGRDTAGTGTTEAIAVTNGIAFTGSSQIGLADINDSTFLGRGKDTGAGTPTALSVAGVKATLQYTAADVGLGNVDNKVQDNLSRNTRGYVWWLIDKLAKVALGVQSDGTVYVPKLRVGTQSSQRETGNKFLFWIEDMFGRVLIGWDRRGYATLKLDPSVGGGYVEPTNFSSEYPPLHVLGKYEGFSVAHYEKDGFQFLARKEDGSPAAAGVALSDLPLRFLPVAGQSNAGRGGLTGLLITTALYPSHCLAFNIGSNAVGTAELDPETITDFAPLQDTVGGQFPATMAAFALEDAYRRAGRGSGGTIGWTAWEGGQELSAFLPGTVNWENMIGGASKIPEIAAQYGRGVSCAATLMVQGEAGPFTGYRAMLLDYIDAFRPAMATALDIEDEPVFVFEQINMRDNAVNPSGVEQDQYLVAKERMGMGVVCSAPMYDLPLKATVDDAIHVMPLGKLIQGERIAHVIRKIEEEGDFTPLMPSSVIRSGADIDITFYVPAGNLEWDTDWILAIQDYGFRYVDDTSTASVSSVTITGANTVRVTLNTTPTGANKRIQYGMGGLAAPPLDGWASGRGQLMSVTDEDSYYHRLGYAIPDKIRHYCLRFEEAV